MSVEHNVQSVSLTLRQSHYNHMGAPYKNLKHSHFDTIMQEGGRYSSVLKHPQAYVQQEPNKKAGMLMVIWQMEVRKSLFFEKQERPDDMTNMYPVL